MWVKQQAQLKEQARQKRNIVKHTLDNQMLEQTKINDQLKAYNSKMDHMMLSKAKSELEKEKEDRLKLKLKAEQQKLQRDQIMH